LITYRVRLDVPRELVLFVSRLLARPRKKTGTRKGTRILGCYRQALFVLAWYRDKADIPRLGAGFGLSQATSYRYVAEGTKVVCAEAPGLEDALERAVKEGMPYVILDGKIVSSDRCHEKTVSRKGREIDLRKPDCRRWARFAMAPPVMTPRSVTTAPLIPDATIGIHSVTRMPPAVGVHEQDTILIVTRSMFPRK